jgi:group I intron endonuclease
MYSIYKILNVKNGKVYVGYTGAEVHGYIREHFANARNGYAKLLYSAIRKHGEQNFSYEVLYQTIHKDHATDMEKYFISQFNSFCKTGLGYNVTFGGDGGDTSHSPIYKAGMKARDLTGPKNGNWGGFSAEHKLNISKAKKGKIPGNYNDFILFAKGKIAIHNPATAIEIKIEPKLLSHYQTLGYLKGRLRVPCPHCGMLSDKSNMVKHLRIQHQIL